ncbi:MAG: Gldg family protein, partial [Sphingomonadales bacterium]
MKRPLHIICKHRYGVPFALLLFVLVNALAGFVPLRLDLTSEKRYTVSPATASLLGELASPLEVQVFLTGEFPSGFKKLEASTRQLLTLFKQLQPAQLSYQFVSPSSSTPAGIPWGDSLLARGALNINLTVQKEAGQSSNIIFPVALVSYQGRS